MSNTTALASSNLEPTVRGRWRRWRRVVAVLAAMVAVAIVIGIIQSRANRGYLHPDGVDAGGARALVRLLEDQGVQVTPASTVDAAVAATGTGGTVIVTVPDLLQPTQIDRLLATEADLVLVSPTGTVERFDADVVPTDATTDEVVDPGCDLAAARDAGAVRLGGVQYDVGPDTEACYPVEGLATLAVSDIGDGQRVVVLGSGALLTNEHLDQDGNASLALSLLGQNDRLTWYRPTPEELAGAAGTSPADLLPSWVAPVGWQLAIAAALAAIWRARRLGPLVPERLPVVVRASETTEGRARLYRRGRSREHAAEILREACMRRLRSRFGLPAGATVAEVAATVGHRTGTPSAEITALLAGPPPPDDASLVRLATDLDTLELEVRTP